MPNATQILRNGSRLIRSRDALLSGDPGGWHPPLAADEPPAADEQPGTDQPEAADEPLTGDEPPAGRERREPGRWLRTEIAASWQRSAAQGVRPDRFCVPYAAPDASADILRLAAAPVADAVGTDLAGTGVSLLVSDREACILDRWVPDAGLRNTLDRLCLAPGFRYGEQAVGTTAISVALSQRRPALVAAGEHYCDTLTAMVCAAAPVIDPLAGDVLGTIGLACRAEEASTLMIPLVKRAARDIEQRIAGGLVTRPREGDRWDSLTAAERDVAMIIAEGATNREAAARLYLSPHTIDYYLRQIFRKLGVASRVELTRLVVTLAARA
jgi:sigma-54 dependent transcriptional regulator, acetoin dehydrogenase operon transcriptional activator AcoR